MSARSRLPAARSTRRARQCRVAKPAPSSCESPSSAVRLRPAACGPWKRADRCRRAIDGHERQALCMNAVSLCHYPVCKADVRSAALRLDNRKAREAAVRNVKTFAVALGRQLHDIRRDRIDDVGELGIEGDKRTPARKRCLTIVFDGWLRLDRSVLTDAASPYTVHHATGIAASLRGDEAADSDVPLVGDAHLRGTLAGDFEKVCPRRRIRTSGFQRQTGDADRGHEKTVNAVEIIGAHRSVYLEQTVAVRIKQDS